MWLGMIMGGVRGIEDVLVTQKYYIYYSNISVMITKEYDWYIILKSISHDNRRVIWHILLNVLVVIIEEYDIYYKRI